MVATMVINPRTQRTLNIDVPRSSLAYHPMLSRIRKLRTSRSETILSSKNGARDECRGALVGAFAKISTSTARDSKRPAHQIAENPHPPLLSSTAILSNCAQHPQPACSSFVALAEMPSREAGALRGRTVRSMWVWPLTLPTADVAQVSTSMDVERGSSLSHHHHHHHHIAEGHTSVGEQMEPLREGDGQ
jgi:hypothetical protein